MAYQGIFKPKNPQKYVGDHKNIIYRSSWEKKVMIWLDKQPSVISWSSEEIIIPYKSPADGKWHRYFVDFYVEALDNNGNRQTYLLEVKPAAQTKEPTPQKRKTKRYITEVVTYGINQAKWKAAEEYCKDKGWEFLILTEEQLFKK